MQPNTNASVFSGVGLKNTYKIGYLERPLGWVLFWMFARLHRLQFPFRVINPLAVRVNHVADGPLGRYDYVCDVHIKFPTLTWESAQLIETSYASPL